MSNIIKTIENVQKTALYKSDCLWTLLGLKAMKGFRNELKVLFP